MSKHHTIIEHDGEEIAVTVEYTFHRFSAGATDGRFGPKLEPDEPAHIEIDAVYTTGVDLRGKHTDLDVSPDTVKMLEEEIGEALSERMEYEP